MEVWLARSFTSSPTPRSRGSPSAALTPPFVGSYPAIAGQIRGLRSGTPAPVPPSRRRRTSPVPVREPVGRDVLAAGREPAGARLVAAATRRLQKARGRDPEHEAAGDDRPRLPAPEVLEVTQDRLAVGTLQIVAQRLRALRGLIGQLRRLGLALLAQLVADAADVLRHRRHAPARVGGALVDLIADAALGLAGRAAAPSPGPSPLPAQRWSPKTLHPQWTGPVGRRGSVGTQPHPPGARELPGGWALQPGRAPRRPGCWVVTARIRTLTRREASG